MVSGSVDGMIRVWDPKDILYTLPRTGCSRYVFPIFYIPSGDHNWAQLTGRYRRRIREPWVLLPWSTLTLYDCYSLTR